MKCPRCGKELEWMGNIKILIKDTDKYFHKLTKKGFSSKDIELWGADWEKGSLFCPNYLECGYHPDLIREEAEQVKIKKKSNTKEEHLNGPLTNDEILELINNLDKFVSDHPELFSKWLETGYALEVAKQAIQKIETK